MPGFSYDLPPIGSLPIADELGSADPEDDREAYIARHGGYWGPSASGPGCWIPVPLPGPDREGRGGGGD